MKKLNTALILTARLLVVAVVVAQPAAAQSAVVPLYTGAVGLNEA